MMPLYPKDQTKCAKLIEEKIIESFVV